MLEPYSQKTQLTKILYGGKGITYKPEEINRIWKMIFIDDLPQDIFTNELKNKIKSIIIKIKEICTINSIPYTYSVGKYTYFTFAGSITNHAISLFFNLDDIKFDDISLTTEKFINWTNLPVNYYEYSDYYDMFFEESSSQSIYQTLLPQKLQSREYIQSWVKNPAIDEILHRLQRSKPIKISSLLVNLT